MPETDETVIVVGAGLAGICAACYLAKNNIDFLILEKSTRVGGIWSSLRWPGIRCDTEIQNYSYSFQPFLSARSLVSGKEISAYLQRVAEQQGIVEKIKFATRVISADFSTSDNGWTIETSRGTFKAKFLLNTNGYFADKPYLPAIAGSETFRGQIVHLFATDRDIELKDKSVVLVGSGASAISAAPALAGKCRELTLLQRSPAYIFEDSNRIGPLMYVAQQLYRAGLQLPFKLANYFLQLKSDLVFVVFRKAPGIGKLFFRLHWRGTVDRETYARHFCPRYNPWEQRIPVAIGFKQLLRNGTINLVTGHIAGFVENGIRLEDGRLLETDTCIFATGFNLKFFRFDISIDQQPLSTPGINFYKGMMMGGIPNYFQPFGPPHTSFTRRIETVSQHIVKIILHMRKQELDSVLIARKHVNKVPRITPGYIMRNLADLPAFYGTVELPSIDTLVFYRFNPGDYIFARAGDTASGGKDTGVSGTIRRRRTGQQIEPVILNEQQS